MHPVNDSINTIREALRTANRKEAEAGLVALDTLQMALSSNPPLAAMAEAFCSEVEQTALYRSKKGGQHVGRFGVFEHIQPSAMAALERYARDFRAAMERKP